MQEVAQPISEKESSSGQYRGNPCGHGGLGLLRTATQGPVRGEPQHPHGGKAHSDHADAQADENSFRRLRRREMDVQFRQKDGLRKACSKGGSQRIGEEETQDATHKYEKEKGLYVHPE